MHINPKLKALAADIMLLFGRVIFGGVFLKDAVEHFTPTMIQEAEQKGMFLPYILIPLSGLVALVGALFIIFGFKTKFGAGLIVKVLIPVTVVMHDFWNFSTPHTIGIEFDEFVKNLGLIGAAFILMYFGGGPITFDAKLKKRKEKKLAAKKGTILRKEMHLKIRQLEIGNANVV
ncbi:MAG: DoxX family protein [Bacteroidia bacterium]